MSSKQEVAVLSGPLAGHAAFAAWRDIAPDAPEPELIEVLMMRNKSATYRLVGVGPEGRAIIAQRSLAVKSKIERTVYVRILPCLTLTAPRYFGSRIESAEWIWIFLEDLGDDCYSATDPAHLALAARWVGGLHTMGAKIAAARRLPDCGAARYLNHLRAARRAMQRYLTDARLTADDGALLETIVSTLDEVERKWCSLELACSRAPSTLVHGDFRPKNTRLKRHASRTDLYPFDWELTGWGMPGVDLTYVDLATYWSAVREVWGDVSFEDVSRLADVGRLFQLLAACDWEGMRFACADPRDRPLASLRQLHGPLVDAIQRTDLI